MAEIDIGRDAQDSTGDHSLRCPSCGARHHPSDAALFRCNNPRCELPYSFAFYASLQDAETERLRLREDPESWARPHIFCLPTTPDKTWVLAQFSGAVQRFEPKKLSEVIDVAALRGMLTGFGDEKGCTFSIVELSDFSRVEPVTIHDDVADLLGIAKDRRTPFRNFTALCLALRTEGATESDTQHPCESFDVEAVRIAAETGPRHYHCPAGLLDFAHPIVVAGRPLAVLLSGQRRLDSPEGRDRLAAGLPEHAAACGVALSAVSSLLTATPSLRPEQIPEFRTKLTETADHIQKVAEGNALEIRKTRDQHFFEEVAGRIRQLTPQYVSSTPSLLSRLLATTIQAYVGIPVTSFFHTHAPESVTFIRHLGSAETSPPTIDVPPSLFAEGPPDQDGLFVLFDSPQRGRLRDLIGSATPELPEPLFLLRILLDVGTQYLLVFHGSSIDTMPAAYAPHGDNHYMRRSFYLRLARTIQGELDIIHRYGNQQKALMSIMHTTHQPLAGILQIESMIRSDLEPGALAEKWLKNIKHTAEHAQALCGSLARVFKCLIDQGSYIDQASDTVDVDAVVRSIAKSLRLYATADRSTREPHRRRLTIEYIRKVRRFSVMADRETVSFVMYNLLHNADKYSDFGSHITVEYSTEGTLDNRLFVKVKSVGEPISAEVRRLQKPFELFWRGTNIKAGLGVGLWACKYLLERQGPPGARGEIHLLPLDERYPRLTVFGVRFPLVAQRDEASALEGSGE